jgi:molybdopterin/thiamine biosynthesis adenylyltransferase
MDDPQIRRYSRHLLLPEIDLIGQEKLLKSRVLVIGLGGLGSPVTMYLASSGVGTLALCDHDVVDLSNLQRQILHNTINIGHQKTTSASATVQALNPNTRVITIPHALQDPHLAEEVDNADIVIDCTDNFQSRHRINAACLALKTPLISGSVIRMAGQVISFRFDISRSPCYCCLYPDQDDDAETCAQMGVLAPVAGIIGSIQATEAVKILLGIGETLHGRLLQLDARTMSWRTSTLKADPFCPACSFQGPQGSPLE